MPQTMSRNARKLFFCPNLNTHISRPTINQMKFLPQQGYKNTRQGNLPGKKGVRRELFFCCIICFYKHHSAHNPLCKYILLAARLNCNHPGEMFFRIACNDTHRNKDWCSHSLNNNILTFLFLLSLKTHFIFALLQLILALCT